ncbi:hypothetical protein CERSUDRAFT_45349 [Gelatoporia subvermispora B]|uniref:AN1-type domain-containing protein n=1 Tax=Ceriporiopsis subvermispora (strain B) TaxID=914234 RepID=M2RLZ5_CERS8|nr:hypothetical protein CERSUDRAFT_45349 [Gelatoporia subvermispora B]
MSHSSTTPERDAQLLGIGKQCSDPTCMLIDFLPFKCQHCDQSFCGNHFTPESHKCEKYDATKHNRVAPSCPLCNEPVAIPPGQDPNVRMDTHITSECSVMTGKTKKSSGPKCAKPKCGKVLFAPIRCDKCKQQFCPQHRFPTSHPCSAVVNSSKGSSGPAQALSNLSTQTSAASAAAMAAIKRAAATTNTAPSTARPPRAATTTQNPPQPPLMTKASSSSSSRSSHSNPFSQQDR